MEEETEYPSWKDALTSGDKIANLRCAGKYLLWHGSYVLLSVVHLLLGALLRLISFASGLVSENDSVNASERIDRVTSHPYVKKASRVFLLGASALIFGACVLAFLYYTYLYPLRGLAVVVGTVGVFAVMFTTMYVLEETEVGEKASGAVSTAASKAKETPGVRRVYGNCPVHMNIEPKWFEKVK